MLGVCLASYYVFSHIVQKRMSGSKVYGLVFVWGVNFQHNLKESGKVVQGSHHNVGRLGCRYVWGRCGSFGERGRCGLIE